MGFWHLFTRKRKTQPAKKKKRRPYQAMMRQAFQQLDLAVGNLQANTEHLKGELNRQTRQLTEHADTLRSQSAKLEKLETLVNTPRPLTTIKEIPLHQRENEAIDQSVSPGPGGPIPIEMPYMNRFSPQQKRILNIFLANQDMALSYQDLAKCLNKSHHTIKNHLREMNLKADLFDKSIDHENRNRFKLKKHLLAEMNPHED